MVRTLLRRLANLALAPLGFEIVRKRGGGHWVLGYVSASQVIAAAQAASLSVSNYLERDWNIPGHAKSVVDRMRALGVFNRPVGSVCEIGTGSGMYAEKVIDLCHPLRYESYEPNAEWAAWLSAQYPLTSLEADGQSLRHTASASMDLVQAHGVFVYVPFLTTYRYLLEIVRVTRDGGHVVFDIMSEECFDDATVAQWLQSKWTYPCFLSKQYVIDFFDARGFRCVGEFPSVIDSGKTRYIVLQRTTGQPSSS